MSIVTEAKLIESDAAPQLSDAAPQLSDAAPQLSDSEPRVNSINDSTTSGSKAGKANIVKLVEYVDSNDFGAAREMLDWGVDVNSGIDVTGKDILHTPLTAAIDCGSLQIVEFLLANGADPNYQYQIGDKYGYHPLLLAAQLSNLDILKTLVKHGANVLQSGKITGCIALQGAVRCQKDNALFLIDSCTPEIVLRQLYWRNNEDKNIFNSGGKNVIQNIVHERVKLIEKLFTAADTGDLKQVEKCFEDEESPLSDVNRRNHIGDTALHCASRTGQVAVVNVLLGLKVDQLIANNRGCIPLHLAARWNRSEVARSLTSRAESEIVAQQLAARDTDGQTPAQLSQKFGHLALAEYLNQLVTGEGQPSLHRALMGETNAATETPPETREMSLLEQMLERMNKLEAENARMNTQFNRQFPTATSHDPSGNGDQCSAKAADDCSGDLRQLIDSLRQDVGDLGVILTRRLENLEARIDKLST